MPPAFGLPRSFLDKLRGFHLGGSSKRRSAASTEPPAAWPRHRKATSSAPSVPQPLKASDETAQEKLLPILPRSDSQHTCSSTSSIQSNALLSLPSPPPITWGDNPVHWARCSNPASEFEQIYDANDWLLTADEENRVRANLAELDANADATLAQIKIAEQAVEASVRKIRRTNHWPDQYHASEVKIMNAQLLEAYHQLDVARAQQDGIETCRAAMCEILHPLRKTPWEILQLIFESLFGEVAHTDLANALPFLLSVVCRKWRHVVRNTPALWTSVKLDVRPGEATWSMDCVGIWDQFVAARRYDALVNERVAQQLQLACTETRNINLKLVFHDSACVCARRSGYTRIRTIVQQAVARAEKVNVVAVNYVPIATGPCECIAELIGAAAIPGKLTTCAFSSVSIQDRLLHIPASSFRFAAIDSVRRLEFYDTFPTLNSGQVFVKVATINFHLPKITLNLASLGAILAAAPNAEVLTLNCRTVDAASGPLPTITRHEKLKYFSFKTKRMQNISAAHAVFLLPQLQQLKLDFLRNGDAPIHAVHAEAYNKLMNFLVSGSNALDVVVLRGMDAGARLAHAITAPEFPRISKLVLAEALLSGEFWTQLETQLTTVSPTRKLAAVECHNMVPTGTVAVQQLVTFLDMQRHVRKVWATPGIFAHSAPSVKVHIKPPLIRISNNYDTVRDTTTMQETRPCNASKKLEIEVTARLEECLKKQWEPVTTIPTFGGFGASATGMGQLAPATTSATPPMKKMAGGRRSRNGAVETTSFASRAAKHKRRTAARD